MEMEIRQSSAHSFLKSGISRSAGLRGIWVSLEIRLNLFLILQGK
jgi:hypothetical protein